jgi:hypothetical protein
MQEDKLRFGLVRRFLLPYTGEEALTHGQAGRLIFIWFVFFALVLSIGTLPIAAALTSSILRLVIVFLLTFFCGGAMFALMASFVVYSINRTALYQQKWQEQRSEQASTVGASQTATRTEQN